MEERALRAFLDSHGLAWDLQVAAYDRVILEQMPRIFADSRFDVVVRDPHEEVKGELRVRFEGVHELVPPTPARDPLRLIGTGDAASYSAKLFLNVRASFPGEDDQTFVVEAGEIPIMLGSVLCSRRDRERGNLAEDESQSGFFVVGGRARYVVAQEKPACNVLVRTNRDSKSSPRDADVARVLGSAWMVTVTSKDSTRERGDVFEALSRLDLAYDPKSGNVFVAHNSLTPKGVSVSMLLLALGHEWTEAETEALTHAHPPLETTFQIWRDSNRRTRMDGVEYVAEHMPYFQSSSRNERMEAARAFLEHGMLPHLKRGSPREYVEYMLSELLALLRADRYGRPAKQDDLDHWEFKRVSGVGEMFAEQMRAGFFRFALDVRGTITRAASTRAASNDKTFLGAFRKMPNHFRSNAITTAFQMWLRTGDFKVPKGKEFNGTTDCLEQKTVLSALSNLRVVTSDSEKRGAGVRALHETQLLFKCPNQTPDGGKVGITKYPAITASRSHWPGPDVEPAVFALLGSVKKEDGRRVFVDGDLLGFRIDAGEARARFHDAKTRGDLPRDACFSVSHTSDDVFIRTDEGRPIVALFRLDAIRHLDRIFADEKRVVQWAALERTASVEWVDVQRMYDDSAPHVVVAAGSLKDRVQGLHTHAQLFRGAFVGLVSGTMPFMERNQGPRCTYGSGMNKQAVAPRPVGDHYARVIEYELSYAQSPICSTMTERVTALVEVPNGHALQVMIASHWGNQEDAVVFKRQAIQRGAMRLTHFWNDTFIVKETDVRLPFTGGKWIGADGIIDVGERVKGEDVLIAMKDRDTGRDTSVRLKSTENGFVHEVLISGTLVPREWAVTIVVRRPHEGDVGDKFSLRVGQKFTAGLLVDEWDLPTSIHPRNLGGTPDMVVNPHAIPSRMTVGMSQELGASKAAALAGRAWVDASAFESDSLKEVAEELRSLGFAGDATEVFLDGTTGELIEEALVMGLAQTQALPHVRDKGTARGVGRKEILTRQPIHGKALNGGLRVGDMEVGCFTSHGAAEVTRDRLLWASDATRVVVCSRCKAVLGSPDPLQNSSKTCRWCARAHPNDKQGDVERMVVRYAMRLLQMETRAIMIDVRQFAVSQRQPNGVAFKARARE